MDQLPEPEVLGCYLDDGFAPGLAAMRLRWPAGPSSRIWDLPHGVRLLGPAPECFALHVQRTGPDSYTACVLWDDTSLRWASLRRDQILSSALAPLLAAMGTDLQYCLDQPIGPKADPLPRAA